MGKLYSIAILALLLFMGSPLMADGGPSITGNLEVDIMTGDISTSATGTDSTASVAIGSVLDGDVTGDISVTVSTGTIMNTADGSGAEAKIRIGVVGD
ncbi:MAG: hypothetical protein ACE5D4_10690 [Thermodesulfobacteriota bacterium]